MNKIIYIGIGLFFIGIGLLIYSNRGIFTDNELVQNISKSKPKNFNEIKPIATYKIAAGTLNIYTVGSDTIFIMEGYSSSSPISIQVK
jgi:hypothetical protein